MNARTLRAIAMAIGIVLLTTAVLYPVILTLMRKLTTFSGYLLDSNLEMLAVLGSAIAKRDSDTSDHNFRVTIIAVRLAEAAGFDPEESMRILQEGRGNHFDPELLDVFTTIARGMYDHLAGRDADDLHAELEGITRSYFSADSGALSV